MAEKNSGKENIMGTEEIPKLVFMTGVPMIVSLLINSLYNFVDSVFVSRLSENALTAVSLASPVQLFMSSLGLGIAVGLNAVISRALGAQKQELVKQTASAAIALAFGAWGLIVIACLLFLKPYFAWQAAGNEEIAGYGMAYLKICMLFSLGQMLQWVFDRFVMASGKGYLFLFTLSAASVTNFILDPILIFGCFGMPEMGIEGAAAATVIGQFVGAGAGILINKRYNKEIPIIFFEKPDGGCILEIIKIGFPSSLVQILSSAAGIAINSVLIEYSTTAVAVYGICTRLQGVVTVGTHGVNNGVIPIVAYNYGAGRKARIQEADKWAFIFGCMFYLPFFLVLEIAPEWVLSLFQAEGTLLHAGNRALRIMAAAYFLSIFCLVCAAVFQGLSFSTRSMYLALLRQVLLPLGLLILLRTALNEYNIWWIFVAAEAVMIPVGMLAKRRIMEKIKPAPLMDARGGFG